jgi:ABC-2 type transport system ATP-binding protein
VISAVALTRHFGLHAAVQDVTFEVARSEIVALLGPNGAGKTTTMRMLAGLIAPTSGSVLIDGRALTRSTGTRLRGRIGFLTETPGLWDRLTVRENLSIYAGLYDVSRPAAAVDRALAVLGLVDRASTRAGELSKGLRQKVALARALLHDPPILLLDEPTSGLDPEVSRDVRRLLRERRNDGCAILVSTHNLDEAERLANRVAVLDRQLLALDRPAMLRRRLSTGRLFIRVAGDVSRYLETVRALDPAASIDSDVLVVTVRDPECDTPAIVRALVQSGAEVLEVRPEIPALEDVYLHLMSNGAARRQQS